MELGLLLPQGFLGEFEGWEPQAAWQRTESIAVEAEQLGFGSIWLVDHLITGPELRDEIMFEAFVGLTSVARVTRTARLGHIVLCAAWRNPALTAKMASTLDVVSGGRFTLGLGAGWKKEEWEAYGYPYPSARGRLQILDDTLEIVAAMLTPGPATVEAETAHVAGAINEPPGVQQPRFPVMVGGNGPNVTWRIAARHADELNLDGMTPDQVAEALPVIADRCEEIGRDPASLAVSAHIWTRYTAEAGSQRVDLLGRYSELGLRRVMTGIPASVNDPEAVASLVADAREAGLSITPPQDASVAPT